MMAMTLVTRRGSPRRIRSPRSSGSATSAAAVARCSGKEILVRHPHLRATLCDNAGVLDSARELLTKRGVVQRVELVAGSFFDAVPRGSDAYVLKHILHDWDDERCIAIMKNCRSAMDPGNRLLVVEAIVEDDTDDYGALANLHMMVVCCDGRERGRADSRSSSRRRASSWDVSSRRRHRWRSWGIAV